MEGRFRDLRWRMAVIALAVGMPRLAMFTDTACATSPNSVHAAKHHSTPSVQRQQLDLDKPHIGPGHCFADGLQPACTH
jgi:hypothetical protein